MDYITSRNRNLTTCKRQRYWRSEYDGTGLEAPGGDLRFAIGSALHAAHAYLLKSGGINEAVMEALSVFDKGTVSYIPQPWEFDPERTLMEHRFLIETYTRVVLPLVIGEVRSEYDVEAVERINTPILVGSIKWYSRYDAGLRNKYTDECWIYSLKTLQEYKPEKVLDRVKWQTQNISEPWAARESNDCCDYAGVVMCWLELGVLEEDRDRGCFGRSSTLVRPWYDGHQFYMQWRWSVNGTTNQVPKKGVKTAIYDLGITAEEWSAMLIEEDKRVLPSSLAANRFYGPLAFPKATIERQQSWLRQVQAEEERALAGAIGTQLALKSGDASRFASALDTWWPMNENECWRCDFTDLCYKPEGLTLIGTKFKPRDLREKWEEG